MASQSSFESVLTPAENPSTPQPLGTEVPAKAEMPRSNSPSTSMLVAPSSITPPPSSQAPNMRRGTPDATVLSSPPPTAANGKKREATKKAATVRPTPDQIETASPDELKAMILNVVAENAKLDMQVSEARMSAAHYKLQYNLLTIESEETLKRMEVENEIIRREVKVLQVNGREIPQVNYTQKMRDYCKSIQEDNDLVQRRLEKAKRVIEMKDDELLDAKDEIFRLQARIRQNREHINVMRSPGGPLHVSTPKTTPVTPHNYRGTPKHTPLTGRSIRYGAPEQQDRFNGFNALVEVGSRVLNQGQENNNSAPNTPTVTRRSDPHTPNRHNRGVHSLSSFPTTPGTGRPMTGNSTLLPSVQFSESRSLHNQHVAHQRALEKRGRSRDSTISASDSEEIARATYRRGSEEVQESQASQSATQMLRVDPKESFEVAPSRNSTPLPNDKYQQSKIYGAVTKRKLEGDHESGPSKKLRTEGVGLGIGFETR